MALINPSSLYTGGNARFDSSPYVQVALRERARKQAMYDALYKHYSQLPDKLNTAGVRIQDFEGTYGGINDEIAAAKDYFMQNKDKILRGGIEQQMYSQKLQGISQKIGQSKSTGQFQAKTGQDFFNGKHDYDEDDLQIKNAVEKSIFDPSHYKDPDTKMPYSYNDYSVASAPYTPQYQLKHDKVVSANVQPDKLPEDTGIFDPVAGKVTYTYGYTPEKIDAIVQTGLSTLKSDKTMYRAMKKALQDPEQIKIASEALQKQYDRTHNDGMKVVVDTPEEMYAGIQIDKFSNAKIPKTFTDKKSIDEYQAAEWNRREAIRQKNRVAMAGLNDRLIRKRKVDGVETGEIEVGYPTNELSDELSEEVKLDNGRETETKKIIYVDKIPVGTLRSMNPKDINKGIYPVQPLEALQPNGSYRQYYEVENDANGNKQYRGKGGKVIGAEDARNNFIKDVVPTNVKLKTTYNKPGASSNKTAPKKKDPLGLF